MRLFMGGSNGLVLYEDGDVTRITAEAVTCLVRAAGTRFVAGTECGSILAFEGSGDVAPSAKDLGRAVTALAVLAGGALMAGTTPPGVWGSKDAGLTWKELPPMSGAPGSDGWKADSGAPVVTALAAPPKDARTIYAGVAVGGVYRSRDGGKRWFDLEVPGDDVHSIQVAPPRAERVYVTTGFGVGGRGAFCSDDEGFNWRRMGEANSRQYTMGLAAHPTEPDRVIISAATGPPSAWKGRAGAACDVYLSTDAGRRFRKVVGNLKGGVRRRALVINPKVPSEVVFGTSTGELWYSSDGGESFDRVGEGLGDLGVVAFA